MEGGHNHVQAPIFAATARDLNGQVIDVPAWRKPYTEAGSHARDLPIDQTMATSVRSSVCGSCAEGVVWTEKGTGTLWGHGNVPSQLKERLELLIHVKTLPTVCLKGKFYCMC